MVAKRFFYVCAGLLCLALAYHLGARSATAQGGSISAAECLYINGDGTIACVARTVYISDGPFDPVSAQFPPVPGTDPVIAVGTGGGGHVVAMLANGDTYSIPNAAGQTWTFIKNAVGGPTPATRETWGGVKARYRPDGATDNK